MKKFYFKLKPTKILKGERINKTLVILSIISLISGWGVLIVKAQNGIPEFINYHGRLKDSAGNPLTGTYNFTFRLYDSEVGGNLVWGPETHNNVQVTNGYFNVKLGSIVPFNLDFRNSYWLSVQVNNDGEMSPRIPLSSFPYAFTAQSLFRKNGDITIQTFNSGNILLFSAGYVGIGTSTPEYNLDVWGRIRSSLGISVIVNVETLSGNKTLIPGIDSMYQWLSTGNENRRIFLDSSAAKSGDKFIIKNTDSYNSTNYLEIISGHTTLEFISPGSIKEFIYVDGFGWVSSNISTGILGRDYNITIGPGAQVYERGIAIGYMANVNNSGIAIGHQAEASGSGFAIGNFSQGLDGGFALGNLASAQGGGSFALGNYAIAENESLAIGPSWSSNYSIAIGSAKSRDNSISIGYGISGLADDDNLVFAKNILIGNFSGFYFGFWGDGGEGNILIGYNSGSGYDENSPDPRDTSLISGSYNILIGHQAWVPATSTSNFLNIGGLIFGTGLSSEYGLMATGSVGIGTVNPDFGKLVVANSVINPRPLFGIPTGSVSVGIFSYDSNPPSTPLMTSIVGAIKEINATNIGNIRGGVVGLLVKDDESDYYLAGTLADQDGIYNTAKGVVGWVKSCPQGYTCYSGFFGGDNDRYPFIVDSGGARININTTTPGYYALAVTTNYYNPLLVVGADGNIGIGTTTPQYKLDVQGQIRQTTSINCPLSADDNGAIICTISSLKYKNILGPANIDIDKFLNLSTKKWIWKEEELKKIGISLSGESIGFIAEEVALSFPELVKYDSNKQPSGIKTELLPFYLFETIKNQQKEINELKVAINGKRLTFSNSDFGNQSFNLIENLRRIGLWIEDNFIKIKNLFVENIKIGSSEKPSGITIYDEDTKEPYCIKIKSGQIITIRGECSGENQTVQSDNQFNNSPVNNSSTIELSNTENNFDHEENQTTNNNESPSD